MPKCFLDISLDQACASNCKSSFHVVTKDEQKKMKCLALEKLKLFLQEKVTFRVGLSAFIQAHPDLLTEFFLAGKENQELITYFLYMSDPPIVKEIIENFAPKTLASLFSSDYSTFLNIQKITSREKREKNFFKVKSNRYWTFVGYQKICDIISYYVRISNEPEFAAQFLIILPSGIVSNLKEYTGFSPEEEIILYKALGDGIYELPIQSPKIYDHMIALFADDIEIFVVLSTMEELIRRQEKIFDLTEKLITYTDQKKIELSIQYLFSELNGVELTTASEILNQLQDQAIISRSQKELIMNFLETGNLDILKPLKADLLRQVRQ